MVNNMNKSLNFLKYYKTSEIIKSFTTSLLFFGIPASIIIIMGVQTILLMVPSMFYVLLAMWILLLATLYGSTKILIETFKNYALYDEFDYNLLFWLLFTIIGVIITIVEVVILVVF